MTSVLHEVVENATNLADSTKNKYLRDLDAWIEFAGDNPGLWTRKKAQAFYAAQLKRIKPQSANRLMATLRFAVKWWLIQESMDPQQNFAVVQEANAKQVTHKQAMTPEQTIQLLDSCEHLDVDPISLRDFVMIVVGLETGMRRMSLKSMQTNFTFLGGDPKAGYPTAHVLMKGSSGERVPVPLTDLAIYCLRAWMGWVKAHSKAFKQAPVFQALAKSAQSHGQTVHVPSGKPLSESAIHKIISDRSRDAGTQISPHVFRHTFVTWRLEAGHTAHQVAAVTGHKLSELGALGKYIDPKTVGEQMRASTPNWLAAYVMRRLK